MSIIRRIAMYLTILTVLSGVLGTVGAQHDHDHDGEPRPELEREPVVPLTPENATEIGYVYEAYLSPQQEGDEEENTPRFSPSQFLSTEPSVPREERPARGHAVLEFANDLSRAYIHLAVTDLDPETVVMLHLHCGRPSVLGPIIVDFATMGNIVEYLEDGTMSLEITNADIEAVIDAGEGPVGAFANGCPISAALPANFTTIGGMEYVARQGELYFNVHTDAQTFYGDIRGAFYPVDMDE